ncbi:MAG: DUF4250 domain-containing protein [Clostridia bacterium]|nr:DUF4250 domain-containing protein [Clostridia bacterium]
MSVPNDPVILLSYINTKLRDEFPSLEELCKVYSLQQEEIKSRLSAVGYEYDPALNKFV